jgi:transcriptional regulator with XRE-family HTH domain
MPTDFKTLLKQLRLQAGYGLREFAELVGTAASNYAGVESGDRNPWRSEEMLRKVADCLGLEEGSRQWDTFFTAAHDWRSLPPDFSRILEKPEVLVLLRTVDEKRLDEDELRRVVKYIRKNFRDDRNK